MKDDLYTVFQADRLEIYRRGSGQHLLTQNARANARPFIHPITAPDGRGVLTEDAPAHHPWQHGLYVGLKRVSGVGFWEEGLRGKATDGSFHPRALELGLEEGCQVAWRVTSDWRGPEGTAMLRETQAWNLRDETGHYLLDLVWTLEAQTDLEVEEAAYGGLFLRMPFDAGRGGRVVSSEDKDNLEADAERARWLSVSMGVPGRPDPVTVTLMDAPSNPDHPSPWRVDGELGVSPSRCIAGPWRVGEGEAARHAYRLLIAPGAPDTALIEETFSAFARQG